MIVKICYRDGVAVQIKLDQSVWVRFEGGKFTFIGQVPPDSAYKQVLYSVEPLKPSMEVVLN